MFKTQSGWSAVDISTNHYRGHVKDEEEEEGGEILAAKDPFPTRKEE